MGSLKAMMRKEFLHVSRDPTLIGFVIGLPLLLIILFGYALRLHVDHLPIAVVDADRTFFSVTVTDKLEKNGQFAVRKVDSVEEIQNLLRTGEVRVGLVIPKGFTENLGNQQSTNFPLYVDGSMPTLAQAALYGARLLTEDEFLGTLQMDDPDNPAPPPRKPPIRIEEHILFNPEMRDADFFLPGTIGIVLMIVVLTLSLGLVREKEQATIEQLMVTPITRLPLITGKMIPYGIIALGDWFLVCILARVMFGVPIERAFPQVFLLSVLFIAALLALGALMSTLSSTQLQATFMGIFVIVTSVLMSGFVFPIEAIPGWLRPVAWALPMTYFIEGIRAFLLKDATIASQWFNLGMLLLFIVGLTSLSLLGFRKQLA